MRHPLLHSMAWRVFIILLVGIVASAGLALLAGSLQLRRAQALARDQRTIDRVVDFVAFRRSASEGLAARALGAGPERLTQIGRNDILPPMDADFTARLKRRLGAEVAELSATAASHANCSGARLGPIAAPAPPDPPRPARSLAEQTCRLIDMAFPDGDSVRLLAPLPPAPQEPAGLPIAAALLVVMAAAAALSFATARLATAPLRRMVQAARALGQNIGQPPLILTGPSEVREAAHALNTMQARLRQNLEERTHMLAAITHDLHTPLTRLRLRLEKIPDSGLRHQALDDHAAILATIREGLDLARSVAGGEVSQPIDVDALLHALADDANDAGGDVSVGIGRDVSLIAPLVPLRRCLRNLVDNAVKYGGGAVLSATCQAGYVSLTVSDRGPGIPDSELEKVMEPFYRAGQAAGEDGAGLGLAIARLLAERCGGALSLTNRRDGGLDAVVSLPGAETA